MSAAWHTFAYIGPSVSEAEAANPVTPVPPQRVRDWLRKPVILREAVFVSPAAVGEWLALKVTTYAPLLLDRQHSEPAMWRAVASGIGRLQRGLDIAQRYPLRDGRFLVLAVVAVWDRPEPMRRLDDAADVLVARL